ncbi:MAG: hypothetical protein NTU73_11470 [Ignavibacteriae bacterium]|nr:hypothetical protein [Ignavibacteriota bacterium]
MNKTIFDLFSIDLSSLPNNDCIETGKRTNSSGQQITDYSMTLNKPELGLFKLIKILQFDDGNKNMELINPNLSSIKIVELEKLVNTLYSFFGKDSNITPLGAFTSDDQHSIEDVILDPINGFWVGRMWSDIEKHGVRISIDDEGLSLFIHCVPQNKK